MFFITNIVNAGLYHATSGIAQASFSKMESIMLDIDSKMTEVYAGTSAYPEVNIMADRKPKITIKGPEFSLGAAYRLLGATNTPGASTAVIMPAIEDKVIPAGGAVVLDHVWSTTDATITVIGIIDDASFSKVASAPTVGQFSVATSGTTTVTFNTSDAGKAVRVFYNWDS